MKARPVLVALAVVLGLLPTTPAAAAPTTATTAVAPGYVLPLDTATSIAVDTATGRVFVGGDNSIAVRNRNGTAVTAISAMYGVTELVAAGGSIYGILDSTTQIVRIDASSLAVTGRWSLAPRTELKGLAVVAGRAWATAEVGFDRVLVSIALATGTVTTHTGQASTWSEGGSLYADPSDPDVLVTTARYKVRRVDVTTTPFTLLGEGENRNGIGPLAWLDATRVLVLDVRVHAEERTWPGFVPTGVLYGPDDDVVDSVATGPGLAALTYRGGVGRQDFGIVRAGTPTPISEMTLGEGLDGAVAAAFSATGDWVYAVSDDGLCSDDCRPAALVATQIGPTVTSVRPRVVGTRGGGKVTVQGSNLNLTSVRVGGQATSGATGTATARTVTVPVLPEGTAPLTVGNLLGITTTSPTPVVVRNLGPFRDSAGFADRQYRDFVGRAATASEALAADSQLAGGASNGTLPLTLARSGAFSDPRAPIIRLYQAIFLRPPDTAGFDYWLGRIRAGRSLTWVASAMANAPEFKTRYGTLTNSAFVDRIYQNVLGRPADASGKAYWVGQLDAGKPRGVVVVGFSQSPEYRAKMAGQVDVTHLYLGMLRRTPTATELAAALATVTASGATVLAEDLLHSTAYRNRVG